MNHEYPKESKYGNYGEHDEPEATAFEPEQFRLDGVVIIEPEFVGAVG
jgi:hypothetical protein